MARNLFTEEDTTHKWNPNDFFQKIYSRENLEDFSIVYGLGQHNPKVPFLFQNLTESNRK